MPGWKVLKKTSIVPFQQVMDEQLAQSLDNSLNHQQCERVAQEEIVLPSDVQILNDHKIAEILQSEYDAMTDEKDDDHINKLVEKIGKKEKTYVNLHSARSVSRISEESVNFSEDVSADAYEDDEDEHSYMLKEERELAKLMYKLKCGECTKHFSELSSKRNLLRAAETVDVVHMGDVSQSCSGLSDRAFNSMLKGVKDTRQKQPRLKDKVLIQKRQFVVDNKTLGMLFKLLQKNWLSFIGKALATGKEATVVHARIGPNFKACQYRDILKQQFSITSMPPSIRFFL